MRSVLVFIFTCIPLTGLVLAQEIFQPDTLRFFNASFEDYPRHSVPPIGWKDCGPLTESPVDVQPFRSTGSAQWGQSIPAYDGKTYLGMVVRDNETWEKVSQRLDEPIEADKCYRLEVYLCKSEIYISQSRTTNREVSYNEPAVLKLWGGTGLCGRTELLAETGTIENTNWQLYSFEFRPEQSFRYITFEAFYKTPVLVPYNGNILMDNLAPILRIPCPEEEVLLASNSNAAADSKAADEGSSVHNKPTKPRKNTPANDKSQPTAVNEQANPKEKILKELDRETVKVDHIIRIERLNFDVNSANINEDAWPVLDEIVAFLRDNPDIRVEIGGHTSYERNVSKPEVLKKLSQVRANAVVEYLVKKGADPNQIESKGYGHLKPIATNFSAEGKRRNQRVEIRIIEIREEE